MDLDIRDRKAIVCAADVTIDNPLPGFFETRPLAQRIGGLRAARDGLEESSIAGYVNAQNMLVDGEAFRTVV